jgi:hypothetical protein
LSFSILFSSMRKRYPRENINNNQSSPKKNSNDNVIDQLYNFATFSSNKKRTLPLFYTWSFLLYFAFLHNLCLVFFLFYYYFNKISYFQRLKTSNNQSLTTSLTHSPHKHWHNHTKHVLCLWSRDLIWERQPTFLFLFTGQEIRMIFVGIGLGTQDEFYSTPIICFAHTREYMHRTSNHM